jgi:hypothetical protein
MNVPKSLKAHDDLYSHAPKRTTAGVPTEDLIPVKTVTGSVVEVNTKTGEIFHRKERSDKDSR